MKIKRTFGNIQKHSSLSQLIIHGVGEYATGIQQIEAMYSAKHPAVHRAVPHTNIYLVPNISTVEIGKPCSNAFLSNGIICSLLSTTALILSSRVLCALPTMSRQGHYCQLGGESLSSSFKTLYPYLISPITSIPTLTAWVPWEA